MKTKDKDKFRAFIKTLKEEQVRHWVEVATAVGVSEATISRWKRLPEAQHHIQLAVINTIENMESAGKKDWRMWEAKLKLLGVNPPQRIEGKVKIEDPVRVVLDRFGLEGSKDAGQAEGTEETTP